MKNKEYSIPKKLLGTPVENLIQALRFIKDTKTSDIKKVNGEYRIGMIPPLGKQEFKQLCVDLGTRIDSFHAKKNISRDLSLKYYEKPRIDKASGVQVVENVLEVCSKKKGELKELQKNIEKSILPEILAEINPTSKSNEGCLKRMAHGITGGIFR